jgi:hypothetical protein
MGMAMLVITPEPEKVIKAIDGAWQCGEVTDTGKIELVE